MEAGFTARFLRNHTFHFGFHMTEISFMIVPTFRQTLVPNHDMHLKREKGMMGFYGRTIQRPRYPDYNRKG